MTPLMNIYQIAEYQNKNIVNGSKLLFVVHQNTILCSFTTFGNHVTSFHRMIKLSPSHMLYVWNF